MSVQQAELILERAAVALSEAERAEAAEIRLVRERHAPLIAAARAAKARARASLQEAENMAVTPHEWDGRKVVARTEVRNRWTGSPTGAVDEANGVVFTYRHGDDIGPGWTYSRPAPGDPMVRLLKKDGTPGKKTVKLSGSWKPQ